MKICFASHNQNKVKELRAIMPEGIELIGLDELGVTEDIAETGSTLHENSEIKARYVFDQYHTPVFADDSGLVVHALNGEPGVYSARYAGPERDDHRNMDLLLNNLLEKENRSAEFQTVITFIDEQGQSHPFLGIIKGEIIQEKRGENGFGYDPIFKPDGYDNTFAELSGEIKNKISHRAKAVEQLLAYLHQTHE